MNEDAVSRLGESRDIAYRRLQGTERRLAKDSSLREQYNAFMEDYIKLGHMREVVETDTELDKRCFLPHHPVIKEASTTTKCILWRFSPAECVHLYELNTVTYGTKSAPFLATRTLKQLALDEEAQYPLAARAVLDDTYMDDVITGADGEETATTLRVQLNTMMSSGGFKLRKWASNCPAVLEGIPEEDLAIRSSEGIILDPDPSIKTLGLTWMLVSDTLKYQFSVPSLNPDTPLTKRYVLSVIATLFDPLGLLGAAITSAKIFMQQLWALRDGQGQRLDWDQSLPSTVGEPWRKFHEQLPLFNEIRIDRCVITSNAVSTEIHCFSDASEKAYGACLYMRNLMSRGISPEDIVNNSFWWQGPSWLEEEEGQWPSLPHNSPTGEGDEEKRRTVVAAPAYVFAEFNQTYFSKFSSYTDLARCTAYWLRYMKLIRTPRMERNYPAYLSSAELKEAENTLVRLVQKEVFETEWKALSKGEAVARGSALRWFNPFISTDQLIRLGGRLKNSMETEKTKHPVVLPARHLFTHTTLPRATATRWTTTAVECCKTSLLAIRRKECGEEHNPQMSDVLPLETIVSPTTDGGSTIVTSHGISTLFTDGCGLLWSNLRKARSKASGSQSLCSDFHLFLQALRRFIARRGRCTDIFSDNGTNFVGARNKLQDFLKLLKNNEHSEVVTRELAKEGIQWHFNPPSAPHFGGLWEAAVRSAKTHLLKVVGEAPVSPEDMSTLLTQVEACLNSRPLTPMSDDPNDLQPLTPAHFLVGESLQAFPESDFTDVPLNRLNQWQLTQRRLQDFWKRWRREYLCQLQGRAKRWKPAVPIDIGTLVIIRDENQPPMHWKMGRIVKVHPSEDGIVRVVTLKTATGLLIRPVEKICLLPIQDDNDDPESTIQSK
ncbi:uncharacterized protein LOC135714548 [Ochlerotatus camptorhynchus]|uniref:uncharacterized protein LOC135714548 n=1 Tax=Ochlerotatus camptorhynchus TaxID=644619 RepID=UPI0031D5509F